MSTAWEVLCDSGVPSGAIRAVSRQPLNGPKAKAALVELLGSKFERFDLDMTECLFAWLRAFRHHWPSRFEQMLGEAGQLALMRLAEHDMDENRYLKLRRIAVENLAATL